MSIITLGPKTQPDRIINITKKTTLNVTRFQELALLAVALLFEGAVVRFLVQGITKPFFPHVCVTFGAGMAIVALCVVIRNLLSGKTLLVDFGYPKENTGVTINVVNEGIKVNNQTTTTTTE